MKEKYNSVIRTYFSNYVTWLLIVTLLFIVSVVTAIAIRGFHNQILLYIVAFLIIYSLSAPLLILYFKARKDIKTGNIETISIKISEIRYDIWDKLSLYTGGCYGSSCNGRIFACPEKGPERI